MANIFDFTDTWNAGGTTFIGIGLDVTDTASASGSRLLRLRVGGTTKMDVDKSGNISVAAGAGLLAGLVNNTSGALTLGHANGDDIRIRNNGTSNLPVLGFYNGSNAVQTQLVVEAQDILAQRRTTNPQAQRWYNTFTDASNYERGFIRWATNVLEIGTEAAGTGTARNLHLYAVGLIKMQFSASAILVRETILMNDGDDITFGTSAGSKIGGTATQKIGFWGATPVIQQSATGETTGFTAGSGTAVNDDSTFTGNVGSTAYRINDIVKHLKTIGLLAA